ncbi:hepatitis A virus cellular receptor 1 homolog [Cricetulus griseus]|uniref:Hepatitis A virus cellular receptor 1 homolog n=1 Tax=Cricetulus griseus TaxID=10029 RepID=A0A9J7GAQ9_CRIGR|nr:hepatitis A virus cellular receptor 1 homolog [Cricetulus griseus]XP_027297713.1 hepatitis A virus cellular receptor 1 homolog [Cricetulus griseus]
MRHTQVLISVLLLLLPAAVSSFPEVHGVVGHPVTLPCSYPVPNGISSMCWGRGECRDTCGQTLIWTDGHRIYYQTSNRYQLKGQNLEGHVSLTIKNVTVSDSGLYCCRVEMKGPNGVQKLTISLQVQPEIPTSPPRGHTTITTSTTTSTRLTGAPKSTRISTSTPLPPSDTLTPKPGYLEVQIRLEQHCDIFRPRLEQSHCKHIPPCVHNQVPLSLKTLPEVFPTKIPLRDTTKITYVGISIAILLLLLLASVLIFASE